MEIRTESPSSGAEKYLASYRFCRFRTTIRLFLVIHRVRSGKSATLEAKSASRVVSHATQSLPRIASALAVDARAASSGKQKDWGRVHAGLGRWQQNRFLWYELGGFLAFHRPDGGSGSIQQQTWGQAFFIRPNPDSREIFQRSPGFQPSGIRQSLCDPFR